MGVRRRLSSSSCHAPRRLRRSSRDETSCVKPEARHGCAGARPSDGGCGGPYRGPPRRSMSARILIVEDDQELAFVLREAMLRKEHQAEVVTGIAALLERIRGSSYDVILLDLKLTDGDGLDAIRPCRELAPDIPIIAMTGFGVRQTATEALRRGAYDFFTKPLNMVELEVVVARALERRRLQQQVAALQAAQTAGLEGLVGRSDAFVRVLHAVQRVARTDVSVLIEGESGTGKDLLAQAIHRTSVRKDGPLVAINCAAIPEGLLESELFGHERGAFTGAVAQKKGRLEMADGGVVFLDEIGELAPALQVKLLRVLQEREIERLGGTRPISVDVRLIAASNRDLEEAIHAGTFRRDLFFRLNVVTLVMPPLRERREDIPTLAQYFVSKCSAKCKLKPKQISPDAMACLANYDWPGNVRELENAMERALVLSSSEVILPEDLPESVLEKEPPPGIVPAKYHAAVKELKKNLIVNALEQARGNYTEAARILGVHANYLHRLIRNFELRGVIRSFPSARTGTGSGSRS